jgi:hypothetical protein
MSRSGDLCEDPIAISDALVQGILTVDVPRDRALEVIECLRTRRRAILDAPPNSDFDYDSLDRIDQILGELLSSNAQLFYSDIHRDEITKLEERIQKLKTELDQTELNFADLKRSFDEQRQADIERVLIEQALEMSELEKSYGHEMPAKYRKFSTTLVALRHQENVLRRVGQFAEAKQVRLDADALERAEMDANSSRWEKDRMRGIADLKRKQTHQLNCVNERWDRHWQGIEPSSLAAQAHLKMVIENTEDRLNEVMGCRNDFRVRTTRSVINAKKEQLPQLTARRPPAEKPEPHQGRPRPPGPKMTGRQR